MKSMTEKVEPSRTTPKVDSELPRRQKLRMLRLLPKLVKSRMLIWLPIRVLLHVRKE